LVCPYRRVAEDELDAFSTTGVGQAVRGENALDGDDEIVPEMLDGPEEVVRAAADVLWSKTRPSWSRAERSMVLAQRSVPQ